MIGTLTISSRYYVKLIMNHRACLVAFSVNVLKVLR